jgi:RNA-directed DNA polymerase
MKNKAKLSLLLSDSCEELEKKFRELKSPRDVAKLLQVPYEYLVYYIYQISPDSRYKEFHVPKKSGGFRIVHSPQNSLKIIQRKLSQVLYAIYQPRPSIHGFAASRSIITNAKLHTKKNFILNLDLKDFFDSINFGRVMGLFLANPYKLDKSVATVLAQICCFNRKLPQGAPSSPIVSNLICAKMDSEFQRFAKQHGLLYTRYADDITFSSNKKELPKELVASYEKGGGKVVLGNELRAIIENNGFQINSDKVRLAYKTQRQKVTGLIVNKKVNVTRIYLRNVDATLHNWETQGLKVVVDKYTSEYAKKRTIPNQEVAPFLDSLRGKIEFIGSIRGKDDHIYQKFIQKFESLRHREEKLNDHLD